MYTAFKRTSKVNARGKYFTIKVIICAMIQFVNCWLWVNLVQIWFLLQISKSISTRMSFFKTKIGVFLKYGRSSVLGTSSKNRWTILSPIYNIL